MTKLGYLLQWLTCLGIISTYGARDVGASPRVLVARIAKKFPHSEQAFTEGLTFREGDGALLESTGLSGKSFITAFEVDDAASKLKKLTTSEMPSRHFGEGIALWSGKLVSLTWKSRKVHVFDYHNLKPLTTLTLDRGMGEGWGLTVSRDHHRMIASDGSAVLHFLLQSSQNLKIVDHVTVSDCAHGMSHVTGLNELELVPASTTWPRGADKSPPNGFKARYFRGGPPGVSERQDHSEQVSDFVLANVITTMCVAVIDPTNGKVDAWILLDDIYKDWDTFNKVANGIAFRAYDRTLWVTGKDWRSLFRIELDDHPDPASVDIKAKCTSKWRSYHFDVNSVVGRERDPCKK